MAGGVSILMQKNTLTTAFSIVSILLVQITLAAELEILLPEPEWSLPMTSLPLSQREGLLQPNEQRMSAQLFPMLRQGEFREALELFKEAYPDAISNVEQGELLNPEVDYNNMSSALLYLLGNTYFSLEQYDSAETAFQSALILLPDYIRVHESLGVLFLNQGRFDEARTHITKAAELGLNTASIYGSLGYLNQETNNPWGSISAYQQALMLEHDNSQWQQGLLHALSQARQYESALALIEQLLEANVNDPDLWLYRAYMSRQTGDDETTLTSLETAIRLGANEVSNLQVSANLHMQIGSIERAVELLKTGFLEGMDFQFFDQALVWLIQNEEWDYAAELLANIQPGSGTLRDTQLSRLNTREAMITLENGEESYARTLLQEALNLDPGNPDALMALGDLYQQSNNYSQAEMLYQRASAYPLYRENALISLAQLAINQVNYNKALTLLRDVVTENPQRSDLSRNIDILENLVQLENRN